MTRSRSMRRPSSRRPRSRSRAINKSKARSSASTAGGATPKVRPYSHAIASQSATSAGSPPIAVNSSCRNASMPAAPSAPHAPAAAKALRKVRRRTSSPSVSSPDPVLPTADESLSDSNWPSSEVLITAYDGDNVVSATSLTPGRAKTIFTTEDADGQSTVDSVLEVVTPAFDPLLQILDDL